MDTDMVYYYGILSIYDMDLINYVDKTKIFLQAHPDHLWKKKKKYSWLWHHGHVHAHINISVFSRFFCTYDL